MKISQLAEWFGVSAKTMSNKRSQKLELLKEYADFEDLGRKGIRIVKVKKNGEYVKKKSYGYEAIANNFLDEWNDNGLDTCKRVGENIYQQYVEVKKDDKFKLNENTTEKYVVSVRNQKWGKPSLEDNPNVGYRYCWTVAETKYVGGLNETTYRFLTEQEKEIFKGLTNKYLRDVDKNIILLVGTEVEDGKLSAEEALKMITESSKVDKEMGFNKILAEFRLITGKKLVKATYREDADKSRLLGAGVE